MNFIYKKVNMARAGFNFNASVGESSQFCQKRKYYVIINFYCAEIGGKKPPAC